MFKGSKKPPKKKGNQPASTKVQNEGAVDGHEGGYDPSETIVESGSSKGQSAGQRDSSDPKATRTDPKSKSSGKILDSDPTGHEGGYDPSTVSPSIPLHDRGLSTSVQSDSEAYQTMPSREAGRVNNSKKKEMFYHRDYFKRPFKGEIRCDTSLNPYTGRLRSLMVQCSIEVLELDSGARWFRKGVQNGSPWMIRISNWAMSRDHGSEESIRTNTPVAIIRWIPACFALAAITSFPIQVAATPSNFGKYDPFLYKDWRYPLDARNKSENKYDTKSYAQEAQTGPQKQTTLRKRQKLIEPKFLCFLKSDGSIKCSKTADWISHSSTGASQNEIGAPQSGVVIPTSYVFVSFTGNHMQKGLTDKYLSEVGQHAAKSIGVGAYRISRSCVYDLSEKDKHKNDLEREETVWSMSDIIRRASAVAIAVPGPLDDNLNGDSLKEWGDRMWTMPELLLYTGRYPIFVYDGNKFLDKRYSIPRTELYDKVWRDSENSGHLIDHYEGSLTLSPLELITMALKCLYRRKTTEYLNGDVSYILMGLLRQRPDVVRSDSDFQAFARLSLANDSNMLLERLICLLPNSLDDYWWSLDDAWNVMLWDIYPKVQICGLGQDDTVILDGARGATIRWDQFVPVLCLGQESMRHRLARWVIRTIPAFFFVALFWTIMSTTLGIQISYYISVTFLGLSSTSVLLYPHLILLIYRAELYESQPFFFGVEGYKDIYHLELLIFGTYERRLQWSTANSPLSRHDLDYKGMKADLSKNTDLQPDEAEEFIRNEGIFTGLDPVLHADGEAKTLVEKAKTSSEHDKKVFTLIDTYTMTVTLFEAVRPPVAVVLCGEEGGMQRALLCSEDWTSGTLYRETVLRMETRVWDKMDTMARI